MPRSESASQENYHNTLQKMDSYITRLDRKVTETREMIQEEYCSLAEEFGDLWNDLAEYRETPTETYESILDSLSEAADEGVNGFIKLGEALEGENR